jgi:hypothetical protein
VTITGTNLTGATQVDFGTKAATSFHVVRPTQIVAISPPESPGTVDVFVTTPAGNSPDNGAANDYTYKAPAMAVVDLIFPDRGPTSGFTAVFIFGKNFTGAKEVLFGSHATLFRMLSPNLIVALSPPTSSPGSVPVTVVTAAGPSTSPYKAMFNYFRPQPPHGFPGGPGGR